MKKVGIFSLIALSCSSAMGSKCVHGNGKSGQFLDSVGSINHCSNDQKCYQNGSNAECLDGKNIPLHKIEEIDDFVNENRENFIRDDIMTAGNGFLFTRNFGKRTPVEDVDFNNVKAACPSLSKASNIFYYVINGKFSISECPFQSKCNKLGKDKICCAEDSSKEKCKSGESICIENDIKKKYYKKCNEGKFIIYNCKSNEFCSNLGGNKARCMPLVGKENVISKKPHKTEPKNDQAKTYQNESSKNKYSKTENSKVEPNEDQLKPIDAKISQGYIMGTNTASDVNPKKKISADSTKNSTNDSSVSKDVNKLKIDKIDPNLKSEMSPKINNDDPSSKKNSKYSKPKDKDETTAKIKPKENKEIKVIDKPQIKVKESVKPEIKNDKNDTAKVSQGSEDNTNKKDAKGDEDERENPEKSKQSNIIEGKNNIESDYSMNSNDNDSADRAVVANGTVDSADSAD
ncbi:hypothetical protein AYI70_g6191, partial [Smittium culicis]